MTAPSLVPPGDADALAGSARRVLDDAEVRAALVEKGRAARRASPGRRAARPGRALRRRRRRPLGDGRGRRVGPGAPGVLLVAEQLRRRVPGGIGTVRARPAWAVWPQLDDADVDVPGVTLHASRRAVAVPTPSPPSADRSSSSRLPGPLLTRAWDHGIVRAPDGFDVVHAVSLAVPPAPARAPCRGRDRARPGVAAPSRGLSGPGPALARGGARRALRRATHFVVPSEAVADDLVAAGPPSGPITVIPLGSDHLPDPDDVGAAALLERLGVRGEFLLSVGTLEPRKNLRPPGRGLRPGPAARCPSPGRWWWSGPRMGPGARAGRGLVFAGRVGDGTLAALYARARLLAYVPLDEGFGLPPVEAMRSARRWWRARCRAPGVPRSRSTPRRRRHRRGARAGGHRRGAAGTSWSTAGAARAASLDVGVSGARPRGVVELAAVSIGPRPVVGALGLSLDVSAVPGPAGRGRPLHHRAGRAPWPLATTSTLHAVVPPRRRRPVARHRGTRAARRTGERGPRARAPARPTGLGAGPAAAPAWRPSRRRAPRPALHDARALPGAPVVTIHDLSFFDHPEWHERTKVVVFRRAIRVAARRADGRRLREPSAPPSDCARCAPRRAESSWSPTASTTTGSGPTEPASRRRRRRPDDGILRRLGVRPPYVVFVGTLEPRKAVPDLVAAFDRVAGDHPELSLVLAGGRVGCRRRRAGRSARPRFGARIVRTGYVPDEAVPALLRQAAVAAYPALDEGSASRPSRPWPAGRRSSPRRARPWPRWRGSRRPGAPGIGRRAGRRPRRASSTAAPRCDARRRLGLEVAARHTWEASAAEHVDGLPVGGGARPGRPATGLAGAGPR